MVQRLLVPSYSCPMHQHIDEEEPSSCPICNMNLVPTTRELEWFCPDEPELTSRLPDGEYAAAVTVERLSSGEAFASSH